MKKYLLILILTLGLVTGLKAQSPLCSSYPTTFCCEYVSSVSINGVTKAGAPDATGFTSGPGYFDYTASSLTSLTAGQTYPVAVTVKTNSSYQEYVKIWFDFNGNGVLSDAGELVFDQVNTFNGTYIYSGNVTIPATAFNGEVYIRVVMVYANSPALCGTYSYGTTLDFKATISGGITSRNLHVTTTSSGGYSGGVTSNPTGINTSLSLNSANFPNGSDVTLTATASGGGSFINWSGDASGSTNPLSITLNADMNIVANFGPPYFVPTLTTTAASSVTNSSASTGGNVTSDGNKPVTSRGVCWNTSPSPTTANSTTTNGSGTGSFTSSLSGLTQGTLYYVRAYAINSIGTGYGNQVTFATIPSDPISAAASASPIYVGSSTQLSVTGAQGVVQWYTGSCGGTLVGTGSPLTVSPTVTTTYYARNLSNGVYSSGCASVTVIVNKYDQTITFDPIPGMIYGDPDFNPASSSSGLAITYSSSNTSVATIVSGKVHITGVGSCDINASQPGNSSYNPATPVIQTLTVSKASLTVTANSKSKIYGASDPVLDYTVTGLLYNGDANTVVTGVVLSTSTGGSATYGTHIISASDGTAANYNITHVNGTLTVNKAPLTVTANNKAKVYGEDDPALDYTASGTLYYSDTYSVITGVNLNTVTGASASFGPHVITASGGTADNYDITHVNGTLTVSKAAALTVTANDKSKIYGANDPELDYTSAGVLYYTDAYSVITGVNLNTATGSSATYGTHEITISGSSADNYNVTSVNGTLTVSKAAALTVTANDKSKVYGAADPELDYTPSGTLYYTDTYSAITGVSLSTSTGASAVFGSHVITAANGTADNYNVTHINGTLTVSKASLTVTANDKAKVYGGDDPDLDYTPSGTLYYTDTYSVISGVSLNTETGASATFGTHTITVAGGTADNYDVNHVNGTLTVAKAELTATANDKSKIYGANDPVLDYILSGTLYYTDTYSVITGVNLTAPTGASASFGIHTINVYGGSAANYNVVPVNGTLTVSKADLNVTANNKSKVYGADDPALDYTPSGILYYSDTYSVITGVSLETETAAAATYGTHIITASGGSSVNYNVNHVNGTLTVSKAAALTVTANDESKVYGADDPVLTYTPSGTLYYSDTYSVITGVNLITETGALASFGTHTITASGGSADNYDVNEVNGTLTVSKAAALTITANDKSKVYGTDDPVLDYTTTGTLYYADSYSVISDINLNTATGASATVGMHTITVDGGSVENYDIILLNGTLTVTKAELIARADNQSKVYGETNPLITITYEGFKYSDNINSLITIPSASTTVTTTSSAGIYPIYLTEGSDETYDIRNIEGVLTIDKAPLKITADNKSRTYGMNNPELTISYSGFVNGEGIGNLDIKPAAYTSADQASDAGQYEITADGGVDNNYSFEYYSGILDIVKADQSITFETIPAGLRTKQQHVLVATSTSGLPVTFESSVISVAEISGNELSVKKEGTVIITASQKGNHNWNPATDITQTIVTLPTFDNIRSLFTPNNDGMNDYWYIPDIEQYGTISVQIYNRFGKLLYKSSAYKNDWDGTYNGVSLPEASYYYIIKSSEKGIIKGVVNLVR
jgi:gliding motility-associated-like protein